MKWVDILKIIKFILELIIKGQSEDEAIKKAASKFGYSENKIKSIYQKHK